MPAGLKSQRSLHHLKLDVVDANCDACYTRTRAHVMTWHTYPNGKQTPDKLRRFGTRSLRSPRAGPALPRLLAVGDRAAKYDRLGLRFRVFAVTRETGAGMGLV